MAMRRHDDVSAFSEFVSARSQALYRLAYVVIGDHQLAQDLVQEALVKAYVAWPRLRDPRKVEGYVRRAIITTAISWRRRRSFHEHPVDQVPEADARDTPDELGADGAVWALVRRLPVRQRAALFLRYHEDLSEAQTAELMGCSVGAVKRQVFIALGKLRDVAGEQAGVLPGHDEEVAP
jgi:RNA polymerase sigma-70 factor (sigma-E family)